MCKLSLWCCHGRRCTPPPLAVSPSHGVQTSGQPVPALRLQRQALGSLCCRLSRFIFWLCFRVGDTSPLLRDCCSRLVSLQRTCGRIYFPNMLLGITTEGGGRGGGGGGRRVPATSGRGERERGEPPPPTPHIFNLTRFNSQMSRQMRIRSFS